MKTRSQTKAEQAGIEREKMIRKTKKVKSKPVSELSGIIDGGVAAREVSLKAANEMSEARVIKTKEDAKAAVANANAKPNKVYRKRKYEIVYDEDDDDDDDKAGKDSKGLGVKNEELYGKTYKVALRSVSRIVKDCSLLMTLLGKIFLGKSLKDKIKSMYSMYLSAVTEEMRVCKYRAVLEALDQPWEDDFNSICRYALINIKGVTTVVDARDLLVPVSFSLAPTTVSVLEPRKDFIKTLSTPHVPSMASKAAHMAQVIAGSAEEGQCQGQGQGKVSTDYMFYNNTIEAFGNEPEPTARADLGYEDIERDVKLSSMVHCRIKSIDETLRIQQDEFTKRLKINREKVPLLERLTDSAFHIPFNTCTAVGIKSLDIMDRIKKRVFIAEPPPGPTFHRGCVINGQPVDVTKILRTKRGTFVPNHVFCNDTGCCNPKTFVRLNELGIADKKIAVDMRFKNKDTKAEGVAYIVDISYQGENPEGSQHLFPEGSQYLLTPKMSIKWKNCQEGGSDDFTIPEKIARKLDWVKQIIIFGADRWHTRIPAMNPQIKERRFHSKLLAEPPIYVTFAPTHTSETFIQEMTKYLPFTEFGPQNSFGTISKALAEDMN